MKKTLALALGGGGVKGLAHVAVFKALDELQLKPDYIVGTSVGAIVGALYAKGMSADAIIEQARNISGKSESGNSLLQRGRELITFTKLLQFEKAPGGLFAAKGLFNQFLEDLENETFDSLKIPFAAVACDFHNGETVVLHDTPLLPSIKASMAVPGIFAPVSICDRLLVDGGLVNNLPCDIAAEHGDIVIASDLISYLNMPQPTFIQAITGSVNLMITNATRARCRDYPPDIFFTPDTTGVNILDFHRVGDVLDIADSLVDDLKRRIEKVMS